MTLTNLNSTRLVLSDEYSHKVEKLDRIQNLIIDRLTWKQFNKYHAMHTKLSFITPKQFEGITKSKELRQLHARLVMIQNRLLTVNEELDAVLSKINEAVHSIY